MFGILLASVAAVFDETFASIGKRQVAERSQSIYTMGFLSLAGGTIAFIVLILFHPAAFRFSLASLPTFTPRVILEVAQSYFTLAAITRADRTTFSFVRIGTIPMLLGVDVILGYTLKFNQIMAVGLIFLTLVVLLGQKMLGKQGLWFVILSTVNAVATISLYKYDITHFNSVAAEQMIVQSFIMLSLLVGALVVAKEDPLRLLKKPILLTQSGAAGVSVLAASFAYMFAPASVIMAATRSSAMLWAILSGRVYFGETKTLAKFLAVIPLAAGIILLII